MLGSGGREFDVGHTALSLIYCKEHSSDDAPPRCVVDEDMALGNASLPFHSIGFNMIGFAKVKYILNTLAMGRDVIFLDTDVVVSTAGQLE